MKKLILIAAFYCLFANFVLAQPKPKGTPIVPKIEELEIIDSANDFSTKGLPEPIINGNNLSDELAVELAKKISVYDEDSMRVLMNSLQKSGFYIIDENQKVLYTPSYGKGMGLAFYDFEVAGMFKLSRSGAITTLDKFGDLIQNEMPNLPKNRIAELMLQDLRAAAKSKNEQVRFWARLIVELGKQFPTPVDLMTVTPDKAQLNIIQASFWERRLVGDVIAFATKLNAQNDYDRRTQKIGNLFRSQNNRLNFLNASYSPKFFSGECDYANLETVQVDVLATGVTTAHGKLLELVTNELKSLDKNPNNFTKMTGLEKIGAAIGKANLLLSWGKLIAAMTNMKGTIEVEGQMPLVRTKSKQDGERRLITGKFEIKVNNLRQLNCYRAAINAATGLDFSMPSTGDLAGKPISWQLNDINFTRNTDNRIIAFDQVVYLEGADGIKNFTKMETDANGQSRVYLVGGKQDEDLTNYPVVPIIKKAQIRADVALKSMKDTKQESADLGGLALGVAMGVSGIGIITSLPEIGFRMKVPVVAKIIPVRDWVPCGADWGGIVTLRIQKSKTEIIKGSQKSNGNNTGSGFRKEKTDINVEMTLNPRTREEIEAKVKEKPASISVNGILMQHTELTAENDPCCELVDGKFYVRSRFGTEITFSDFLKAQVPLRVRSGERDWEISIGNPSLPTKAKQHNYVEVDSNCGAENGESKDETLTIDAPIVSFALPDGRYGNRFVNSAGELLEGEKTINSPDGTTYTYSWALARCSVRR